MVLGILGVESGAIHFTRLDQKMKNIQVNLKRIRTRLSMGKIKCCVESCKEDAEFSISINGFEWGKEYLAFCDKHYQIYHKHTEARDKYFSHKN